MKESTEQFRRLLPADAQSSVVLKPGDRALDGPSSTVPTKRPTVLRDILQLAVAAMRRDHLDALLGKLFVQAIAVVRPVSDHPLGRFRRQHEIEETLNQPAFVRIRRGRVNGYRQPPRVHENHDFHAFSDLRPAHAAPTAASFYERTVDEAFVQSKPAAMLHAPSGVAHDLLKDAVGDPSLEPAMHGALGAELARQVL